MLFRSNNPAITNNGAVINKLNPFNTGTGNHAYQLTPTARPKLRALVNLLTKTEAFDDSSVWSTLSAGISPNVTQDPLGGNTADKLLEAAANSSHRAYAVRSDAIGTYTVSVYAKAAERIEAAKLAIELASKVN